MLQRLPRIAALFGLTSFTFRLGRRERDWLIYISILPLLVIAAIAVELYIRIDLGNATQLGDNYRFYVASQDIPSLALPVSVAVLFVAGVAPVSKPVASWAALIASVLILIAFVSGAFVTIVDLGASASRFDPTRYYSDVWRTLSYACGFLAVGYAFLAYRGLNRTTQLPRPRKVREQNTDDQPREL
jgi:hypothetical protein